MCTSHERECDSWGAHKLNKCWQIRFACSCRYHENWKKSKLCFLPRRGAWFWKTIFRCKFLPSSGGHNYFAPRSALAIVFWKSQNPGWRWFGVGRAECAGALGGDMRRVWDLQTWDWQIRTCALDLTRQLCSTRQAADSIAPRIPPGRPATDIYQGR